MGYAEDAMAAIGRARDGDVPTDVRTQLDSIAVSLREMTDTERGEWSDEEGAFADTEFQGAAPDVDNLDELEETLDGLAEETGGEERRHIEEASRLVAAYRDR